MDNFYKFNICIVVPCIYGNLNREAINYWIKYQSTSEYPKSFDIFKKEIIKKVNFNKYG